MSEYSEAGSVNRLIGAPPGYVNHEEGGQLTELLKKNPYSVVLVDEIEKAHPKVLKVFLQIFDEGRITDTKGIFVDCRHSIFILTTNLGSQKILSMSELGYNEDVILKSIQSDIIKVLSPELYNRLEPVVFNGLTEELVEKLVCNELDQVIADIFTKKRISISFEDSVIEFLKIHGFNYDLGARPLKRLIQLTIVTTIAQAIVKGEIHSGDAIRMSYKDDCVCVQKEIND